jgi:hypothetical protein
MHVLLPCTIAITTFYHTTTSARPPTGAAAAGLLVQKVATVCCTGAEAITRGKQLYIARVLALSSMAMLGTQGTPSSARSR